MRLLGFFVSHTIHLLSAECPVFYHDSKNASISIPGFMEYDVNNQEELVDMHFSHRYSRDVEIQAEWNLNIVFFHGFVLLVHSWTQMRVWGSGWLTQNNPLLGKQITKSTPKEGEMVKQMNENSVYKLLKPRIAGKT